MGQGARKRDHGWNPAEILDVEGFTVRKSLTIQRCVTVLAVFMLLGSVQSAYAYEGSSYWVDGEPLQWELEGVPDSSRPVDYVEFRLVRITEDAEPLMFTLSELVDDQGNEFPRALLLIDTLYDSANQTWNSETSQVKLMASEHDIANLKIGLHYREKVPAGIYRGSLYSDQGDDIPIEIVVNRYTTVFVNEREVSMDLPSPGVWVTDPVVVQVGANHGEWTLKLFSSGLFPQVENTSFLSSLLEESQERPLELVALVDDKTFPLGEGFRFSGSGSGGDSIFRFRIQTETGLEHKAGHYAGVIQIDVEVDEE